MKKIFEEPVIECTQIFSENVTAGLPDAHLSNGYDDGNWPD